MRTIIAIVTCLFALGCQSGSPRARDLLIVDSVTYHLPPAERLVVGDTTLHWSAGGLSLDVRSRMVEFSGIDLGRLYPGDDVELTPEGRVFVNGRQRRGR